LSWEIKGPQVSIALLLGGDFLYKDMMRVAFGLQKPQNTLFLFESKKPDVALSRNILAAQALREKTEWIFYLDSDVIPPLNVIPRLLGHNLPITSGLYWRRYETLQPCIYKLSEEGLPKALTDDELSVYGSMLMEVEGIGAGCLLIHSSVFEKLKPTVEQFDLQDPVTKQVLTCWKFFEYIVHHNVNLSEDIVLASRVRGLGYKIFADLSVRCGHLTTVIVKDGRYRETPLTTGKEV
jgi:hypothetical protein